MNELNSILGSIFNSGHIERKREEAKANARDRYHAKKIAKQLGLPLTIERTGDGEWCCWIEYHVSQVGPKGWSDELYCRTWADVRNKLEQIQQEQ